MKRKSIVLILALALALSVAFSATACGKNKHEFSNEWKNDGTHHWHECTTKGHTDTADNAEHTFGEGIVTTEPTETAEGVMTYTCTVCGYRKTDTVKQLAHVHTFDNDAWKHDEQDHWHPATCAHTDEKGSPEKHVWDEGTVTTAPTETTEGVKTYTCVKCGRTKTSSIGTIDHVHTFDTTGWAFDSNNHWHPATCAHTDERDSIAPHDWDEGEITTPAGYGTAGEKTYSCNTCDATRTETIAALNAKDNVITFASDLSLDKTYDGTAAVLSPEKVNRKGDGEISVMYKAADASDGTYTAIAPKNAGEYTAQAIVAATAEWKGGEITTTFTIEQRTVELTESIFERKFEENLESGKFGLTCIDVAAETNNDTAWVTICASEENYAIGIHEIAVRDLFADSDNFVIDAGGIAQVRLTVWDAPDFYAGIKDVFSMPDGRVIITTKIARGTVKTNDRLLVNEIGRTITVNKIEKGSGSSATVVDTATAGEDVSLLIGGATKGELNRGYMLTMSDEIIGYSKVTATIRAYTKDEGGQNAPITSGISPQVVFDDTFGEVTGKVTFPEGTTMLFGGNTLSGVTIDFQGKKIHTFAGCRFRLRSGGKTIAEGVITALPHATRVICNVSEPAGKTVVVGAVEKNETTFAVNLIGSTAFENLTTSEAINLIVKYNNTVIGTYSRTGLGIGDGDLAHVENGGTLAGSFINVNFAKNVSGLTDADGKWIGDSDNVTFNVTVGITEMLNNLGVGSAETITLKKGETRYFTINELENLAAGWYSFVNAIENLKSRYEVYTSEGEKASRMYDMFKSAGVAYIVKYTAISDLTDEPIGVNAAKAELSATNKTSGLVIPAGKQGDRIVIKVTVNKAVTYHHENMVRFKSNVAAFNGASVKVFNNDYSTYAAYGYQSLPSGHTFRLPSRNNTQTYAYIMMRYAADLDGTAELDFNHVAGSYTIALPEPTADTEFKIIEFNAKISKNIYFKVTSTGKYKIEIAEVDSTVLVSPTIIRTDKLYDPDFALVNVNSNTNFNADATGYYSLVLTNTQDSVQRVRVRVVKVS